jgi:transposase InsO family protein
MDLVERQFFTEGPDRLRVGDITYIPIWSGFLYLAMVLDVYSRRIMGWSTETHLRAELILAALNMAITQRQPSAVIHHSDRGCQYTSYAFGKRCRGGRRDALGGVRGRRVRLRDGGELLCHAPRSVIGRQSIANARIRGPSNQPKASAACGGRPRSLWKMLEDDVKKRRRLTVHRNGSGPVDATGHR